MDKRMPEITESSVNIIAEGTRIEGSIVFDEISRVHGTLVGDVLAKAGSTLILAESALVEGNLKVDHLYVDGFVRGDIDARTKVVVSGTGRVIGNIRTPSLLIEYGGYFEGDCSMEKPAGGSGPTSSPSPRPA